MSQLEPFRNIIQKNFLLQNYVAFHSRKHKPHLDLYPERTSQCDNWNSCRNLNCKLHPLGILFLRSSAPSESTISSNCIAFPGTTSHYAATFLRRPFKIGMGAQNHPFIWWITICLTPYHGKENPRQTPLIFYDIWHSSFINVTIEPKVRLQQSNKWSWLISHKPW